MERPAMPPTPPVDTPPSTTTTFLPPLTTHTHTIIFLHEREDYGSDLAQSFFDSKSFSPSPPTFECLSLRELFPSVKWVFPTAAMRYCAQRDEEFKKSSFAKQLEGEEIISQWFDIWDLHTPDEKKELQKEGLRESIQQISQIVEEEAKIIISDNIILGGISQGCATAIYTVLATGIRIGGFMGLSSWLPFQKEIEDIPVSCHGEIKAVAERVQWFLGYDKYQPSKNGSSHFESFPMFFSHSKDDKMVPYAYGKALQKNIKALMNNRDSVIVKKYDEGGHWIHPRLGVDDMFAFLHNIIGIPRNVTEVVPCVEKREWLLNQARYMGYEQRCMELAQIEMRNLEREKAMEEQKWRDEKGIRN